MIQWICLHNYACVVTKQISTFFPNFIWRFLGPNEMSWPNELYLVIWVNLLSNSECRFEAMMRHSRWFQLDLHEFWHTWSFDHVCCDTRSVCCDSVSIYFFPLTIGSFLPRMKWVDQMTLNWSFEYYSNQIQNASVRQRFNGFVYTTSHVFWLSKSQKCIPLSFECFLDRKKWVEQV